MLPESAPASVPHTPLKKGNIMAISATNIRIGRSICIVAVDCHSRAGTLVANGFNKYLI
jgi:hypothetical protein